MNDFHFSGVPNAFGSGRDPQEQEPTRSRRRRGRKASAVPGFGSGSSGSSGAPGAGGSGFGSGAQGSGPSGARGSAGFGSGSSGSSGSPGAWGSAGFGSGAPGSGAPGSGAPQASGAPGPSGFSEPSGPAGAPGFGTASPGTSAPASPGTPAPVSPGGLTAFFRSFRASRTSGQAADDAGSPVRSSRTTRPAVVLCVLGLAGIAWGSYHFLASIDVFGVVFSGASLIHLTDVLLATLSALLVFLALLLSVRGMVVSRPRRVPAVVFAAALLLPLPVAVGSLLLGAEALKDNVVDDAWDYVGQVSPQDVDTVYDQLEGYGIRIPGREEVHRILTATAP